jgi:ankyrin repeat protein
VVNIEAKNMFGETPLHRAAKYNRKDYVKELSKWGGECRRTPLQAFLNWKPSTYAAHHILHHDTLP